VKLAIGAGNGGGVPRGAAGTGAGTGSGRGATAGVPFPMLAAGAAFFAGTLALASGSFGSAGFFACAALTGRFGAEVSVLRARVAPGRFALARAAAAGFLVLDALMTRAPQTLLSAGSSCQLSTRVQVKPTPPRYNPRLLPDLQPELP
jgi:hypothetical protein